MEGGRRQLFCFAMQSRRRRKKADGGRCGIKIEATLALPVFGQTRSIEFAEGVISSVGKRKSLMAVIDQHFPLSTANGSQAPMRTGRLPQRQIRETAYSPFGKTNGRDFRLRICPEQRVRRAWMQGSVTAGPSPVFRSFGRSGPLTRIIATQVWSRWMPRIDAASSDAGPSLNRPRSGSVNVAGSSRDIHRRHPLRQRSLPKAKTREGLCELPQAASRARPEGDAISNLSAHIIISEQCGSCRYSMVSTIS